MNLIGLITDVGGRGDGSYNDSALRGLEMWAAGKKYTSNGYQPLPEAELKASIPSFLKDAGIAPLGVTPVVLAARAAGDYAPNLDRLLSEKVDLVIGLGSGIEGVLGAAAKKSPQARFLLIDPEGPPLALPNVKTAAFREHEGSYLAGVLAGLATHSGRIGFVGGVDLPLIRRCESGFVAGVMTVSRAAAGAVKRTYTGSFNSQSDGERAALDLFNQGVDVVYHAAGAGGLGVIKAAKAHSKFVIGVDSDQSHLAPSNVLTSMLKLVDYVIFTTAKEIAENRFRPGDSVLGLKENGVALAPVKADFANKEAALAEVEKLRLAVVAGRIKVPSTPEELRNFTPPPLQ